MEKTIRSAFVWILLSTAIGVAAERVVVIADDDGTADKGRGQVTSHRSVVRKTLLLTTDPAAVTQASIMYYMKIRPYDVASRRLHAKPAPGIEWADLVLAVNGEEVFRGSLIEHGAQGWHEAAIDPKLLRRGENNVTMTLSRGGSYFYLGIDRAAPQGRSASSVDGGKTFRQNWLSFATDKADTGEYMIRLKVRAEMPDEVGFVERRGQFYGWLEVEDLFAADRAHASGFKALTWKKGANQPSRGKLAWGPEGRFLVPFDVPADRHWRLWVRGWMDGFRGGAFKLSWNGKLLFDSRGKHEFTSDARLRLDWLDVGTAHLGEGKHNLEIETSGDCGHMFDVFVLTTDFGFTPDAAAPLPRMTKLTRLVGPRGVSELKPGLFMTPNPTPWATPLADGPLRTLWVCADINEREVVELQRRMDMTADVVSSPIAYFGKSVFGSDLPLDRGDLLYNLLASNKLYDVAVLVRTKLDQIPSHAMTELLRRVREGMGLIVVTSLREGESDTELSALMTQVAPLTFPAMHSPVDLKRLAQARWCRVGQGCVVRLAHSLYGTMDRVPGETHEMRYPFWEYQFAQWLKFLLWASGRSERRIVSVTVPEVVAPGAAPLLSLATQGSAGAAIRATCWGPFSSTGRQPTAVTCQDDRASITLPAVPENGLYRVGIALLDADGRVLDLAATHYRVERPVRVTSVEIACEGKGDHAAVTLATHNSTDAPVQILLQALVVGARDRLIGQGDATLTVAPGEGVADLDVPLIRSGERLLELRLTLHGSDGTVHQRLHRLLTRPQPAALNDYIPYAGVWENLEVPCYCRPVYMRIFDELGIRAVRTGGAFWHSLDAGFATALPYRLTSIGSGTVDEAGLRTPCLHDKAMLLKEATSVRERTKSKLRYSPLALGLGDEMQVGRSECCFSSHTLEAFRAHLRKRYATLNALNRAWQTEFGSWEQVRPYRLAELKGRDDNLAPWLEFRAFMASSFVDAITGLAEAVKEEAPSTLVGGVNPWGESHNTCVVLSKLFPRLEYGQIYPRFHDRARSWFRDPRHIGLWSGYSRPRAQIEREAWLLPAYGGTLMCWYGVGRQLGYGTLTNTLDLGERATWIGDCNRELTSGIGRLLVEAEVEPEPVAILHSFRSRCAYIAREHLRDTSVPSDAWNQRFNEFEEGFVSLLRTLHIGYRFVDEDEVEGGALAQFKLLVMPQAVALSDGVLARIRTFAAQYPVVCTPGCGVFDEDGHLRKSPPFAARQAAGVNVVRWDDQPAVVDAGNLARLRKTFPGALEDEIEGNISLLVRKRLKDLTVLVGFGSGQLQLNSQVPKHVYNARTHVYLGYGQTTACEQERSPVVLVLADRKMPDVALDMPRRVRRGVPVAVELRAGSIDTVVHMSFSGPDGKIRGWYDANVRLRNGQGRMPFVPALNDTLGAWRVHCLDVVSGGSTEMSFDIVP